MQADMEGETIPMKSEGRMVNILTKLDLKLYRKYIRTKRNKPIIYVEQKNPCMVRYRILFCSVRTLTLIYKSGILRSIHTKGCVVNKTVNGKQLTVVWHVDDLKVSHMDSLVVSDFLELLKNRY